MDIIPVAIALRSSGGSAPDVSDRLAAVESGLSDVNDDVSQIEERVLSLEALQISLAETGINITVRE